MSADAHAPAAAGHHEPSKFHYFIAVAMVLAVITGIEVVLVYMPLAKWVVVSSLCILSAFKFLCVIFIFMHLKWDKLFCTILFFIGLTLAGGTVGALMAIFSAHDSVPLKAQEIYAERAAAQ